eukprot:TRINITY_DN110534_c0_g1_i1.p1 TRINITY_DN110534_c0_g1~~TRINITY_DN110534_c0_g1_i1.p1  ORF type:complete len:112 (+),score=11.84 TRINITY_DN110534_c0_g1_i1:30-338(+)
MASWHSPFIQSSRACISDPAVGQLAPGRSTCRGVKISGLDEHRHTLIGEADKSVEGIGKARVAHLSEEGPETLDAAELRASPPEASAVTTTSGHDKHTHAPT